MRPASLTQLLYSVAVSDAAEAPTTCTPVCVSVARLRTCLIRENWTNDERQHLQTCGHCQQAAVNGQKLLYHPPLTALMQFVRSGQIDGDCEYHLDRDACRRCQRLLGLFRGETLLARLSQQQLARVLPTAEVLSLPPPGCHPDAFQLEGERYRVRVAWGEKPTLRIESLTGGLADAAYVTGTGLGEQFVTVHESGTPAEYVSLRVASLPEWGEFLIVPAQSLVILAEARTLWNRYQAKTNVNELRAGRERR